MPPDNFVFTMQTLFSFTALLFCCIMLGTGNDPSYYLPVLTSIIGYWLPSPRGSMANVLPTVRSLPALLMRRQQSTPPEQSLGQADSQMNLMESGDLEEPQLPAPPLPPAPPQPPLPPAPPQPPSPPPPPPPPEPRPPKPVPKPVPTHVDRDLPMRLVKFSTRPPQR